MIDSGWIYYNTERQPIRPAKVVLVALKHEVNNLARGNI